MGLLFAVTRRRPIATPRLHADASLAGWTGRGRAHILDGVIRHAPQTQPSSPPHRARRPLRAAGGAPLAAGLPPSPTPQARRALGAGCAAGLVMVAAMACGGAGSTGADAPPTSPGGAAGSSGKGSASAGGPGGDGGGAGSTPFEPPTCADAQPKGGFHVTVDGTPKGDGSLAAPWDIATGLVDPPGVGPGATIWIHGGTYHDPVLVKLDGAEGAPIHVRAWPGDRVTIDSSDPSEPVLQIYRSWTILEGLEITNSDPDRRKDRATGIWAGGKHNALRNLVVHDVGVGVSGGQLDGDQQDGVDTEVYGSLFYDNGFLEDDGGHGHHLYLTNRDGRMTLEDNILASAYGFGCHLYSETDKNYVQGYSIVGNVWFLNGAPGGKLYDGCLIGHDGKRPVSDVVLKDNLGWAPTLGDRDLRLGYAATGNHDITLSNNYLVGQTVFVKDWTSVTMKGNRFVGSVTGLDVAAYPGNEILSKAPTQNHVVIRPNHYQPGRAHVVVYNWEGLDVVAIDPGAALPKGAKFALRDAEDYYGKPVLSGTYAGGPLAVPMAGRSPALPLGETSLPKPEWATKKAFGVFVLDAAVCDGG